jgi:hypothetical protein
MKRLILMMVACLALAGCESSASVNSDRDNSETLRLQKQVRERADYWQRADSVSAQYLTGPKAQHQLNKDIAACVAEVRELVRLGSIRRAEPPANVGMDPGLRAGWNSPTHDGPLYTEYTDFQDFDGCMKTKGWERIDYVKPVVAKQASTNYLTTILGHTFGWGMPGSQLFEEDPANDPAFNR